MICKIVYFSEAVFPETCVIQIQDELIEGDSLFVNNEYTLTIEHVIENENIITILDGDKILKLEAPI